MQNIVCEQPPPDKINEAFDHGIGQIQKRKIAERKRPRPSLKSNDTRTKVG